jgi:hypothetical protein
LKNVVKITLSIASAVSNSLKDLGVKINAKVGDSEVIETEEKPKAKKK